jgi:hypothetical protein
MVDGDGTFRFSTSEIPKRDRIAVWRESVGRDMLRFDIEPLNEESFSFRMSARALTGLRIISVTTSPVLTERTRALLADGDDSFCMLQMSNAAGVFAGCGREVPVAPREAIMMRRGDAASFAFPAESRILALHIPRMALAPQLQNCVGALTRPIPAHSEPLRLLDHVLTGLQTGPLPPDLQRLSVDYVYDLLGLALGATGDAAEAASRRGLRAARLRAIKDDIRANLHRPDLTAAAVAKRHRITPRYVRMLFEQEDTSFSRFGLPPRLRHDTVRCAGGSAGQGSRLIASSANLRHGRAEHAHGIRGAELHLQAALAAVHHDRRMRRGRFVDEGARSLALAKRRDAADVVAGRALRRWRGQHGRAFRAGRGGELLEIDLAVGGHQHAHHLVAGARHQCLEQPRRLDTERVGRLHADARRVGVVLVFVQREGNAGLFERPGGRGGFGHCLPRIRPSYPAKAGYPVHTEMPWFTGSPAFAGDDAYFLSQYAYWS